MVSALPSPRNGMTLSALMLLAPLVTGGDTLSGRGTDGEGHPLAGATVLVVELHRVALSHTDGRFRFADMPVGIYTVTVRRLGFAPLARRVTVSGSTTLDLTLERTSVWVEPVTVTATRAPLDVFSSPLPTEALSEDRLRRAQSVSLTHALPDASGGPRTMHTGFEISGASNNAELEGAARVEGASGGWGWRLFGIGRFASSLHTPAGELANTGFSAISGEAAVGTRGGGARGSATLRYTRYGGQFQLPQAPGPATGETGGPERKLSDDRVQLAGDYLLGGVRLATKAQWQRHSLIEVSDTGTSPGGAPLEGTAFDLLLNTLTLDVLAHHTVGTRIRGTLGASGFYQTNDTRGRIPLVPDARARSAAVFAFEEAELGRVSVLAGGRVDLRRLTAHSNSTPRRSGETRDYTALSGTMGVVYRPTAGGALAAQPGRAPRAPP